MIVNVFCFMQCFDTLMVCVLGSNFTQVHDIVPINRKGVLKPVIIPILKQSHVKTYMGRGKCIVLFHAIEKAVQMSDVVHDRRAQLPEPILNGFFSVR